MKIKNIKKSLDIARLASDIVPCYVGYRGIGKTHQLVKYGHDNGFDVVVVHLSQFEDVGDLTGLPIPLKEEGSSSKYYTVYAIPQLFQNKENSSKPLFLILDEINHTKPHIRLAAFQLIRHKKIGGNYLGDDAFICAACNPDNDEDYQVEYFQNAAWEDSFCWIKSEYCHDSYLEYCNSVDFMKESKMLHFLAHDPQIMKEAYKGDFDLDFVKPSARSVEKAAELHSLYLASDLNSQEYDNVFDEVMTGIIGQNMYIPFKNFKQEISTDPKKVLLYSDKDLSKYAKSETAIFNLFLKNTIDLLDNRFSQYEETKKDLFSEQEARAFTIIVKNTVEKDLIAGQLKSFLINKIFSEKDIPVFKKYILNNKELSSLFGQTSSRSQQE